MTDRQLPEPHADNTPDTTAHTTTDPAALATDARRLRRTRVKGVLAGAVGVAALGTAGLVGVTVATAADTPTPSATSTAAPQDDSATDGRGSGPGRGHHGGFGPLGGDTAALAEKLGVTEDALEDALETAQQAIRGDDTDTPAAGARPDREAMQEKLAGALAEALDLDTATVTAALEEQRTEAQADQDAAFGDRLDQAVTDGKLTRAEADAVLKAADAGVIGTGGRGPR